MTIIKLYLIYVHVKSFIGLSSAILESEVQVNNTHCSLILSFGPIRSVEVIGLAAACSCL